MISIPMKAGKSFEIFSDGPSRIFWNWMAREATRRAALIGQLDGSS
jgi:hypothetical protein